MSYEPWWKTLLIVLVQGGALLLIMLALAWVLTEVKS